MDTPSRYPPNRLKRNTACQRCNQRKTKCDAVRPTCGACVRHNRHRERSKSGLGPAIACIYDDAEGSHEGGQTVPGESVASGPSSGLVADRPTELPPRALLSHLVRIFFANVPSINHLIHETQFLSRLSKSPSHPDFPHHALLHAICAVAGRFTAAVHVETVQDSVKRRARFLDGKKAHMSTQPEDGPACFADHQAKLATIAMDIGETYGRAHLEVCQAQIILVTHYIYTAQFHRGFLMAGQAFRLGQFLGLLTESASSQDGGRWATLLPHPTADWDREERRRLACSLVLADTSVSLCGAWPLMLFPENIAIKLPAAYADFRVADTIPENLQNIRTLTLFDNHPVPDSFVMYIKAMMLLRLVIDFRAKSELAKESGADDGVVMPGEPVFAFFKRACREFVEKLPSSLQNPDAALSGLNQLDPDVVSAHIVPHVAMIVHCEPYAHIDDPKCEHSRSVYAAALDVSAILHKLLACNTDWKTSVVPLAAHWLQTASGSLLQHYRRALVSADLSTVTTVSTALDTFKEALSKMASHNAVAYLMRKQIQSKLDEINKEVFENPSASLDPTLFPQPQDPVEEFRWDEYLLWPMNWDQ